jgi:regulation of enolase protein 1 (concanavalin A-like superfamily)
MNNIINNLYNKPITEADKYYKSSYDRLTKQIQLDGEYYQIFSKNGIIINIVNMKQDIK